MGQEPSEIREEIEATREQMGTTVDAIAYKADVPSRVKDSVADKRDRLKSQISSMSGRANEATPSTGDVKDGAKQAVGIAQENPLGLAIGGVAIGFLAGLALPSTQVENERVGPIADEVKSKAKEAGQEAVQHGKEVAQEAAQAATETAREAGQQHAEDLRGSAQEKASDVRDTAQSQAPGSGPGQSFPPPPGQSA